MVEQEWPDMFGAIMELKEELEEETFKKLSIWGHPCIFLKQGFTWDLKRAEAYPCMYQINICGCKVYKLEVLWDAGNATCARFLTNEGWQRITGYALGEEQKGDLVEFVCYFGAIGPYYPLATAFAGTGNIQGVYKILSRITLRVPQEMGPVRD